MGNASELLTRAVSNVIPRALAESKLKSGKQLRIYWGIDPTGSKIHLGHAVPLRKMQEFVEAGHHVTFLIGSFTAMIGDPSDKEAMRQPITREDIEKNFQTYKEQASKVLDFSKVEIRYNHEWLEKLTLEKTLELASHFTIQQLEERDMFQRRMQAGKPVSFHEFFYPLMVGYDSVVLDVDCEIGGSEQEFNMLAGRTLQKAYGKREKFILTLKLIEGTDGRKMSKTYDNCVYLTDEPGDMYGKLMSINDNLILIYMECCTDISMKEIEEAKKAMATGGNPKNFKMQLAKEIVSMYHGKQAAAKAEKEFENVFKDKGLPDDIKEAKVKKGSLLVDVMVEHGLASSKSEARRLIEQGGVKLDEKTVSAIDAKAGNGVLKVGKRKFLKIFSY